MCRKTVAGNAGLERVFSRVQKLEAAAQVLDSDAGAAAVVVRLREVAVFHEAFEPVGVGERDGDAYERVAGGADSVFEGVFNKRNEEQRGDEGAFAIFREADLEPGVGGEPQAHQFDVAAGEVDFPVERDEVLRVVVEHVAEQFAEVLDGVLRPVGVDGDEGVDVVERVEKEVRVQLAFQIFELGFRARFFQFLFLPFYFVPVAGDFEGHAEGHRESHEEHVAPDEEDNGWVGVFFLLGLLFVLFRLGWIEMVPVEFLPGVEEEAEGDDVYQVDENEADDSFPEQGALDDEEGVGVEEKDAGQGKGAEPGIPRPRDGARGVADDEERQQEHESPAYHVDGDEHGLLYRTFSHGGVFRKVSDSSQKMKGSLVADRVYRVKVGGFLGRVPPEEYSGDGADKE